MKLLLASALLALSLPAFSQAHSVITPRPSADVVQRACGNFSPSQFKTVKIDAPAADVAHLSGYLAQKMPQLEITDIGRASGQIKLRTVSSVPGIDSPEGYRLDIKPDGILVEATSGAGLFYGLQSLIQLMESGQPLSPVTLTDQPRFSYRGVMIDVSRNFRDKEFIKKQLDAMAALKLNKMQFHLTDGAGWRLQIDRYPRLTDFAAWRKGQTWKDWTEQGSKYLDRTDSEARGGYYTKDDIREILDYAADRYITVIPEIEMPGHSEEVLAAYPELSCEGKPYTSSDFCPGKEATFEFLQNVLDEVIELFPSKYINIGGDEAGKAAWRKCPDCKARMEAEGLENVEQLQSYLIHRIEKYLNSKGRDLIGWDEIMEGGLAPNAAVVSWRGVQGGAEAARQGHKAVMAPGAFCYFDGYQDAPQTQPEAIGGYLPLEKVYSFNPAPDSLDAAARANIMGLEATMFTEYIPTDEHAEYMLYPRMIALAEVAWTPQERRDYTEFRPRAEAYNRHLAAQGYNVFDLSREVGNRKEALTPVKHLALNCPVTYNVPWWTNYNANYAATLTDGLRGGWTYSDGRWQGFLSNTTDRVDVTIDLGKIQPVNYVGAEFMQLCGPDVWMPCKVIISASEDGKTYTDLAEIDHDVVRDTGLSFKTFSWEGSARARYIRYRALAEHGVLFTDEFIVR